MKSGFVPVAAAVVILVFGLALAAALLKGIVGAVRRRSWPVVDGVVQLATGEDGRKNSLARIRYTAPDGGRHVLETKTGGMSTNGRDGQRLPLSVDPSDPANAVPKAANGTLATMGCMVVTLLLFVVFAVFVLVRVLG
ncbi:MULTISPECIES: DUF3592 domain-containing protein [Dermacoccus]|uniref:DUF3592 domain-containing protein n=1 Tax=Dermacoccus TaxID=57495 RepID=UPI000658B472|nr:MULTISPECIES: DUF3592 domain-containing protein [Dermacoccus]MBZ4497149.1 DUF3592 domain-containing protein [Dermacoccus sp. Tok2021]KLO64042.1 hypothetical protein AA983_05170 [Dermacoccus sp. PE3]MBE7372282.1 DUF3592 domain-containing protein [Dermacoccus barathri]MCT1985805.1 DUF3592 domain-containing protein [Dermacoccus abyssi]QNK53515.1 DUF3592 domain-containing protein [Dermacoccus sp. PAMC28757]